MQISDDGWTLGANFLRCWMGPSLRFITDMPIMVSRKLQISERHPSGCRWSDRFRIANTQRSPLSASILAALFGKPVLCIQKLCKFSLVIQNWNAKKERNEINMATQRLNNRQTKPVNLSCFDGKQGSHVLVYFLKEAPCRSELCIASACHDRWRQERHS